jgi:CheY-like chemotaxis protein
MNRPYRVALLGLQATERDRIAACLRQTQARQPGYVLAPMLNDGDVFIADADHQPSLELVRVTERLERTIFLGAAPPDDALHRMTRPIEPGRLLRELDALVAGDTPAVEAPAAPAVILRPVVPAPKSLAVPPLPMAPVSPVASPRPRAPAAPTERRRPAQPPAAAPEPPPGLALLVDDSELALRFLESRLKRYGLVVDRALSSGRAIELMSRRHYDFVFLDVELGPDSTLDGLALCQRIKRHQDAAAALSSAVFMVSAHHGDSDRVRGTLAGCDAYLAKPLDEDELARLLARHGVVARGAPTGA